jgi:hypothetical protein
MRGSVAITVDYVDYGDSAFFCSFPRLRGPGTIAPRDEGRPRDCDPGLPEGRRLAALGARDARPPMPRLAARPLIRPRLRAFTFSRREKGARPVRRVRASRGARAATASTIRGASS